MLRKLTGIANHIHKDKSFSQLEVHELSPDLADRLRPFVTVGAPDRESIIIHSLEQWKQVDAIVRKAFDSIS